MHGGRIAHVVGGGPLQRQPDIRHQAEGRARRAAAADLLLAGEHKIHIAMRIAGEQAKHVVAADAVVQSARQNPPLAERREGGVEGDGRTCRGLLQRLVLVLGADVHVELVDGQHALAVLGGLLMDGHGADDAAERLLSRLAVPGGHGVAHLDPLGHQHPRVDAADGPHMQKPLVRGGNHHQAHLVHVGGYHHMRRVRVAAPLVGDHVAHAVDGHVFLAQSADALVVDGGAHQLLAAADALQFTKLFQLHSASFHPSSRSPRKWASSLPHSRITFISSSSTVVCMYFNGRSISTHGTPSRAI